MGKKLKETEEALVAAQGEVENLKGQVTSLKEKNRKLQVRNVQ